MLNKRETDTIIYYDNLLNWYHVKCEICNDYFLVNANKKRVNFCSCSKLIKSQNQGKSIIYILSNNLGLIKIGLSVEHNIQARVRKLTKQTEFKDFDKFEPIHLRRYTNRAEAYSIERLIHNEMKDYKVYGKPPCKFEGQGEIYPEKVLPFIFELLEYKIVKV